VVGDVVMRNLDVVQPNSWNPNEMTPFMMESLKRGLQTDGWLASQALLVWATDENGNARNIIIDGEHRWTVARELGMKKGPMVFLENVTEAYARKLTVAMNHKRGESNKDDLGELLRGIQAEFGADLAFEVGIEGEDLMKLLAEPPVDLQPPGEHDGVITSPPGEVPSGMATHVKMIQLFFNQEQHEEFVKLVKQLAPKLGTKNVSDTSLEVLRRAGAAQKSSS
jgi:hypothetical protein